MRSMIVMLMLCVAAPAAAADRYVVVARERPLYVAPAADAATIRVQVGARGTFDKEFAVYRLIGERDGWAEIESVVFDVDDPSGHCEFGEATLSALRLRLFVRIADLTPVATRAARVRFGDGTWIDVAPGLPLRRQDGRMVVADLEFVAVARDLAGSRYTPLMPRPVDPLFNRTVTGKLGGVGVTSWLVDVTRLQRRKGKPALASVRLRCGAMTVAVADEYTVAEAVEGIGDADDGVAGAPDDIDHRPGHEPPWLPVGAAIYWADGRVAGSMRVERYFDRAELQARGGRICWRYTQLPDQPPLCADPRALRNYP
jgi:hypothetical protein